MNEFPRTTVENLSLSRMIIGTNWFFGWSHTSAAKDKCIRETLNTTGKIADIIEVFLKAGVDTLMGLIEYPGMKDAITEAENRVGRKVIVVSTPGFDVSDAAMSEAERTIERNAKLGTAICMPHMGATDKLHDHRNRRIVNMDKYCAMIRQHGMIPGLSTHVPESVVYADETGLDVGTYIQIYNAAGFLMHIEVDWVHKIIWNAKHPVMTIKPMAAGQLRPFQALTFVWNAIREQDMVTVGTMSPKEAEELIEISLSVLQKKAVIVNLQETRSKSSVKTKA